MRAQWFEFTVGTLVLLIAALFMVFGFQKYTRQASNDGYILTAQFQSVEGVSVGTDVRMAGVKIGSVAALDLNPHTLNAEASLLVRDDILIPDDSIISIASEGLLGGHFIEVQPGGSDFSYAAGDAVANTQSAVSFINLLLKFVSSGSNK